jgi:hypothetical protein
VKLPDFKFDRSSLGKGPELHVPDFAKDLYADLRDRRLLPLVVVLVVAIVAAPILLQNKSSDSPPPSPIATQPAVDAASFTVVPATNGIKSYKKRLKHRRSVNPFNPFSAIGRRTPDREELDGAAAAVENGGNRTTSEPTSGAVEPPTSGGEPSAAQTTTVITKQPKVVKATLKAQVGVAAVIKAGFNGSELKPLEIEDQARLPQNKPAIIYNGTSKKEGALFLMTSQVSEFKGEGHCVVGGSLCQVVELKPEQSETFTIGYGESRYTIHLLGFRPIVKEEVIEAEGRKVRVPNHNGGKSQTGHKGDGEEESVGGTDPSPRWLLR